MDGTLSIKARETRRLKAVRLLSRGKSQADVARELGVSMWANKAAQGGKAAVRSQRLRGRPAQLGAGQLKELQRALKAGAVAAGFATELWTLPRIRGLIQEKFEVRLSESWIFRLLRGLGWSCQRPEGRARERDEAAIRQWKQVRWPPLKKAPRGRAE